MEEESFIQPEIGKFLISNFILIRINIDKKRKIASSYYVRSLPTSCFLEADGSKINNIPGYVNPKLFLTILKYIASESYRKMTLKEYMEKGKMGRETIYDEQ